MAEKICKTEHFQKYQLLLAGRLIKSSRDYRNFLDEVKCRSCYMVFKADSTMLCFLKTLQRSLEYTLEICHYIQPWQHVPEIPP